MRPAGKEEEESGGGGTAPAKRRSKEEEEEGTKGDPAKRLSVDCSTLTDLHSSTEVPEVEVISLLGEDLPRYRLRADYLTEFGGYGHGDFARSGSAGGGTAASVVETPVLTEAAEQEAKGLTADQAEATLDYLVSCGARLSAMTRAYHDVEAVTRLLAEKEKDLELAAKIGQELLERNRFLDEKVQQLEAQLGQYTELITQLRHELQVKTDLLRVYSASATEDDEEGDDDAVDAAGGVGGAGAGASARLRAANVELLQKKIKELEKDNRELQEEATELAKEAFEVEEKEEKLVSDAVKHLTEANVQISYLSEEFSVKSDESRKQKEEITHLLAQVCDYQNKTKHLSRENDELRSSLGAYAETQDELTAELGDLKDKYREVVDLLRDAQEELKRSRRGSSGVKGGYSGAGTHALRGMFQGGDGDGDRFRGVGSSSLQAEIHSSIRSNKRVSKKNSLQSSRFDSASDFSDSEGDSGLRRLRHHHHRRAPYSTLRAGADAGARTSRGAGAATSLEDDADLSFDSYSAAASRDNADSPSSSAAAAGSVPVVPDFKIGRIDLEDSSARPSDTLLEGTAGGLGSIGGHPGLGTLPRTMEEEERTVGELRVPFMQSNALSSPLGSVPSLCQQRPSRQHGQEELGGSLPEDFYHFQHHHRPLTRDSGVLMPSGEFHAAAAAAATAAAPSGDGHPLTVRPEGGAADGMSDDGEAKREIMMVGSDLAGGEFPAGRLDGEEGEEETGVSSELEEALKKLTPEEVERRRKRLSSSVYRSKERFPSAVFSDLSYDVGSDGYDSPGSLLGKPGFHFLPYGVRTPDSLMSASTQNLFHGHLGAGGHGGGGGRLNSAAAAAASWRLPDKLRIVKPLEGSFTLHHWQRLAVPHLGNVLEEERSGVAVRGGAGHALMPAVVPVTAVAGDFAAIDSGLDLLPSSSSRDTSADKPGIESIKEDAEDDAGGGADETANAGKRSRDATTLLLEDTRTQLTLTDSTVLHPDDRPPAQVQVVDSGGYSGPQMSLGLGGGGDGGGDPHHHDDALSVVSAGCFDSASAVDDALLSTRASSRLSYYDELTSSRHGSISDLSTGDYGSLDRRRYQHRARRLGGWGGGGGFLTFSNNIGLARVLNERHIEGYMSASTLSLNNGDDAHSVAGSYAHSDEGRGEGLVGHPTVCSLTPSVISTPACAKSFSPTGTPLNSPCRTPPGSPPPDKKRPEEEESGLVLGFFSALRTAIYGEQQKEAQTNIRRQQQQQPPHHQHRRGSRRGGLKKFGILEKVEEVGVENLLSASPLPEERGTPSSRFSFGRASSRESSGSRDLDGEEGDDELEPLQPGSLTINTASSTPAAMAAQRRPKHHQLTQLMPSPLQSPLLQQQQPRSLDGAIGELRPPSFFLYGRPSLDPRALGSLPPNIGGAVDGISGGLPSLGHHPGPMVSGRGPGRTVSGASPGERRPAQISGALGVPGTPGTGALLQQQRTGGVRPDLGSVPIVTTATPGQREEGEHGQKKPNSGFIGSIANVFFGRKGGLL